MDAILIQISSEKEKNLLTSFLEKTGIKGVIISEKIKRYLAGLKMIEIAERHPKFDISDEEVVNMLKEGEDEVYGKYRNKSSD